MFRTLVCSLAVCFFSALSSSQGISQEFYQSLPSYSAPISYQPYSVQSFPAQSFPVQDFATQSFPTQSFPVQYAAPTGVIAQLPAYQFSGTQNQVYSSGQGVLPHIIDPNYGYDGPGDMRTHLWNDHAADLRANGVSRGQLDSMSLASVQKWHNFFHGTQGRPSQ